MAAVNREQWLTRAIPHLAKIVNSADVADEFKVTVPEAIQVSCSWPGRSKIERTIGQCWQSKAGKGVTQVFISPLLNDPHDILAVLIHELVHAADDNESKHAGRFVKVIRAIGLEGKPTATHAGEALSQRLAAIADKLGDYPHTGMDLSANPIKKQTTRMLKVQCESCGCIARMTAKWLDEAGEPTCGCGGAMVFVPPTKKKESK